MARRTAERRPGRPGKVKKHLGSERPERRLGEFLRTQRQSAGLTQRDVADTLGFTTAQFVSNWERGVCAPPTKDLPTIASLFGTKPSAMISAYVRYLEELTKAHMGTLSSVFRPPPRRRAG